MNVQVRGQTPKPHSLLRDVLICTTILIVVGGAGGVMLLNNAAQFQDSLVSSWVSMSH